MRFLIYFSLTLTGALGILQMNKDLQYNCYYQILKKYSTKSIHSDDSSEDYNHQMADQLRLNIKDAVKTEPKAPHSHIRREIIMPTAENHNHPDQPQTDIFAKTFSSAFAEPRNSGRYRQSMLVAASKTTTATATTTIHNATKTLYRSKELTYFVVAPKIVRPGFIYKISLSVLRAQYIIKAFANISCNGVNISSDTRDIPEGSTETFMLSIPSTALQKDACKLRMEGFFLNVFCDLAFLHENALEYCQHSLMILIETDKPLYTQSDVVRFRVTVTKADFKPFDGIVEIIIIDPNQHIVHRWLTQLAASGSIALAYRLAEQSSFGAWSINVSIAEQSGQQEIFNFLVEEYYQARFEVEIKMPEAFFSTAAFVNGSVSVTSEFESEPFRGRLRLAAKLYPIGYLNLKALNQYFRLGSFDKAPTDATTDFLSKICESSKKFSDFYNDISCNDGNLSEISVTQLNRDYIFKWPMLELTQMQKNITAYEILVTASVTADDDDEMYFGYAISHLYQPSIHVTFLGGTPQVFKPSLPFKVFIAAEHMNGSPIASSVLKRNSLMVVSGVIRTKVGLDSAKIVWPQRRLHMLRHRSGIWELKIDLREDLAHLPREVLNEITEMRLQANFSSKNHQENNNTVVTVSAELLLLAHYSPRHQHIKVITSTELPTVGEYIIFEITTNFYVEEFHYMVLSKGLIIRTERESLFNGIKTIALVVGIEMAPVAEILVWTVTWQGEIVTDSLSFPVMGMFVNNFTVGLRSSAVYTKFNHILHEVSFDGASGSYVTLSGITEEAYNMQAHSSRLSYLTVISKMSVCDKSVYRVHKHAWHSDRKVVGEFDAAFYAASSIGIDANNTFLQSGLIIFTDGALPNYSKFCSRYGGCDQRWSETPLPLIKICDKTNGIFGSNEALNDFKRFRINRLFRHYKGIVWLWKDIQIGPDGHTRFYTNRPPLDAHRWVISSQSTSPEKGIGVAEEIVIADLEQPFVVNVVLPTYCRIYEYIDVQVNLLHRRRSTVVATISLRSSPDYSPVNRQQRFPLSITLAADERKTVHIPIMLQSSGKLLIALHIETVYGATDITRSVNVERFAVQEDHQQRLSHHHSILLNLTERQNYMEKYMNITKSSILKWTAISVGVNSFGALFSAVSEHYRRLETAQDFAFAFADRLYSLMYYRLTNRPPHNATAEKQMYQNMNHNYQILLSFLRPDGSFSQLRATDSNYLNSSVWLTSHCLRLFQDFNSYKMIDYIWIDSTITEKILIWILDQQTSEGNWLDSDDVDSLDNDITLTAHVLITLVSMKNLNFTLTTRIEMAKVKALTWIESNILSLRNSNETYDLAITSYALLLCKSSLTGIIFPALDALVKRHSDYPGLYWISSNLVNKSLNFECYDSLSIEITAYALLSFIAKGESDAELIANWLIVNIFGDDCRKRITKRASNAAIFALIQFTAHYPRRESTEITIELIPLTMSDAAHKFTLFVNSTNASQMQSIELFDVWGTFKISAKGVGYAILQVYHVKDEDENVDDDKDRDDYGNMAHLPFPPAFLLRNEVTCRDKLCSRISYTSCINWSSMHQRKHSDMSILAVTIPSGYRIQQQQLDSYVLSGIVKHLIQAKLVGTKVLFYFAKISEEAVCIHFSIKRWYAVTNFTHFLPIRIYEYNSAEIFVETVLEALPPIQLFDICAVCGNPNCTNCHYHSTASCTSNYKFLFLVLIFYLLLSFKQSAALLLNLYTFI